MATTALVPAAFSASARTPAPLVIAHRGASGYRPEHTLASYRLAVEMGADYIEPDLVPTKDGVLVARHESNLIGTTDVALRPEFTDRRRTRTVDGRTVSGWFTEDFTYDELRTLRAVERLPLVRPANATYDGRFLIPTFEEVLQLAADESRRTGRTIGVAPETKHPTYFAERGLAPEPALVRSLRRYGLDRVDAPVIVQSFEADNLRALRRMTAVPIVQLVDLHQAHRLTPAGLREISTYAEWVGPHKDLVLPPDGSQPSAVVADAHGAGLRVVTWTLRAENQFLAPRFRTGDDPKAPGDIAAEVAELTAAGVDGMFADHPDLARDAVRVGEISIA